MNEKIEYEIIEDYSRGSDDKTFLCKNSEGLFFKKIAYGEKNVCKLKSQVEWIIANRKKLPLPEIIDVEINSNQMYYSMSYHKGKTFSDYVCDNNVNQSIDILINIIKDLENNLYIQKKTNNDSQIDEYIQKKVIDNINSIMSNELLSDILKYDNVIINGRVFQNLHKYSSMFSKENLHNVFANDRCGEIHGDLTLENIIISSEDGKDYYLIDPNTNNSFNSVYLDYAKILQSLHGKYELIRKKSSSVSVAGNIIQISYNDNDNYTELYKLYEKFLYSKFNDRQLESIFYHEVVHWLRLYKYRNKHESHKILLYYSIILIILNDLFERVKKDDE